MFTLKTAVTSIYTTCYYTIQNMMSILGSTGGLSAVFGTSVAVLSTVPSMCSLPFFRKIRNIVGIIVVDVSFPNIEEPMRVERLSLYRFACFLIVTFIDYMHITSWRRNLVFRLSLNVGEDWLLYQTRVTLCLMIDF